MLVSFFSNGSVVDTVDTAKLTPVKIPATPNDTPIATDPALWGGYKTTGSYQYENAGAGQAFVAWQTPSNSIVRMWPMDDNAACDTLINTTIPGAMGATPPAQIITVISDGLEYSS